MSSANRFVWVELMTGDQPAAVDFYRRVVGWTSEAAGAPGMPYTLLLAGDAKVAGVMTTPLELAAIGHAPTWSGYVGVADVDAAAAAVIGAGGKLLRPVAAIPGVGRFAVAADPQGASFMIFQPQPGDPPVAPRAGAPGSVGWYELHALDGARALDFYGGLFGWTRGEAMDMGPSGVYQLFEIDGVPAGGIVTKSPDRPAPGWDFYFNVDAIDAAVERLRAAGGQLLMGPHEVPGGSWIAIARDPQGASFSLVAARR
jgi:predicted enzyme related to lactoylglutathione lyase